MYITSRYCPHCDAELDTDSYIYTQDGNVIGCDNCIKQDWADFDEEDEEELEEELEADYYDSIRDEMHIERVFGL